MKFLVIVQCFVALAVAAPQGYQYGLPKFSGDASLIGAGSGAHFSSLGGSGSASSFTSGAQFGHQHFRQYAPEIQKHVYVHVPPPEHEVLAAPRVINFDQPRKHYKIIFIKAPSPPAYQAPIIQPPAQDEEKTVVYVLVKKPDPQPDIHIPTPAPTVPAKPEVYFIKYNTHKDIGSDIRSQPIPHAPTAHTQSGAGSSLNHLSAHSSNTGSAFTGSGLSSGSSQLSGSSLGGSAASGSRVSVPHTQYGVPL